MGRKTGGLSELSRGSWIRKPKGGFTWTDEITQESEPPEILNIRDPDELDTLPCYPVHTDIMVVSEGPRICQYQKCREIVKETPIVSEGLAYHPSCYFSMRRASREAVA